jgi:hypothetical protein
MAEAGAGSGFNKIGCCQAGSTVPEKGGVNGSRYSNDLMVVLGANRPSTHLPTLYHKLAHQSDLLRFFRLRGVFLAFSAGCNRAIFIR